MKNRNDEKRVLIEEEPVVLQAANIHLLFIGNDASKLEVSLAKARWPANFKVEAFEMSEVDRCARKYFDLVVLDGRLGAAPLETVRTIFGNEVPFIMQGSDLTAEERIYARSHGVISFVYPEPQGRELIAAIQNIIYFMGSQSQRESEAIGFSKQVASAIEQLLISRPVFGVQDLCQKMQLSHSTMYRRVKKAFNQSPNRLIGSYRCRKAAQLLEQGDLNITAIAYACGFSSPTYFARAFKQFYGLTPGQFRKRA